MSSKSSGSGLGWIIFLPIIFMLCSDDDKDEEKDVEIKTSNEKEVVETVKKSVGKIKEEVSKTIDIARDEFHKAKNEIREELSKSNDESQVEIEKEKKPETTIEEELPKKDLKPLNEDDQKQKGLKKL